VKIVSVVGARPQFVKAAPVSRALRAAGHREVLVHTGQHYDDNMSQIFFEELGIPRPDVNLVAGSGLHGAQTALMLQRLEEVMLEEKPDWVLIYGDTNSTLAGALAASKLHLPVAHVEAGLRSFNRMMPEEINRVVADHLSALLLCPSRTAVDNLAAEGIKRGVHCVGDVMYDAVLQFSELARERSTILGELGLESKSYMLATVHRAENTGDALRLRSILAAFADIGETVIFPVHPRTRKILAELKSGAAEVSETGEPSLSGGDSRVSNNVRLIEPVGYLDMLTLEQHARVILTDSGGIQKEAYWFGVPCVTLREETEWVETLETGWNTLAGADRDRIMAAVKRASTREHSSERPPLYGDGHVAERCVQMLETAA
jgi:UDP-N-acetylglucosamine 2-epimerase